MLPTTTTATGSPRRSAPPPARATDEEDEEEAEADPPSITDVFANMLEINEDLLAAAAECHADDGAEGSIAYQRLLHRNLMEMANFIDSRFGVYTKSASGDDSSSSDSLDGFADDEPVDWGATTADLSDALDAAEPIVIARNDEEHGGGDGDSLWARSSEDSAATPGSSALLATLEADEVAKVKQRSKKRWLKAREQVIEQESASASRNEVAERMATVTAGIMKGAVLLPPPIPLLPISLPMPPVGILAPPMVSEASNSVASAPSAERESTGATAAASPAVAVAQDAQPSGSDQDGVRIPSSSAPSSPSPFSSQATPVPTPAPIPQLGAETQFFAPPQLSSLAPFLPLAKIALPSTHSLVNVLYPVAASVYPPIQLSTVCSLCALQHKTVHECRMVLKHVTPPLLFDPAAVPGLGLVQWPPPPSAPPAQPAAVNRQLLAKSFKRMCDDCRKCHFSVHRCRTVLQHIAPEWQPTASAPAAPRRRKSAASRKGDGAKPVS